jgi:hormone-sensitive lipase
LKNKIEKVILHIHGGAFVCMSSFQHTSYTRQWANLLKEDNVVVFSVDYRLAPENPFPLPFSDCLQIYCWIVTQGFEQLGINPKQIIVAGDSAGGHLACAIT